MKAEKKKKTFEKLKYKILITHRVSFFGFFLQTLPDLVTPLRPLKDSISAQLSTDAVSALRSSLAPNFQKAGLA